VAGLTDKRLPGFARPDGAETCPYTVGALLEHGVGIGRSRRNGLEDVQCSTIFPLSSRRKMSMPAQSGLRPLLVTMQHHVVALADHSFKLNVFSGIVLGMRMK